MAAGYVEVEICIYSEGAAGGAARREGAFEMRSRAAFSLLWLQPVSRQCLRLYKRGAAGAQLDEGRLIT